MSKTSKVSHLIMGFCMLLFSSIVYSFDCSFQEELGYYYKYFHGFELTADEMLKSIELGLPLDAIKFSEHIDLFRKRSNNLDFNIDITNEDHDNKLRLLDAVLEMFAILKNSMNIPNEVELYAYSKKHDDQAFYAPAVRRVYINLNNSYSFSFYKFLLIHELTHVQQHQRFGSIGYCNSLFSTEGSFACEHEADTAAAQAISCPLCMQVIEDILFENTRSSSFGYLSCSQFREYKNQKQCCDICNAHGGNIVMREQLNEMLPKTNELNYQELYLLEREQRIRLNYSFAGSAQDCLSTVRFDSLNQI